MNCISCGELGLLDCAAGRFASGGQPAQLPEHTSPRTGEYRRVGPLCMDCYAAHLITAHGDPGPERAQEEKV